MITAGALMAFQALAIVGAGPASAAPTCNFNLATHTVGVTIDADNTGTMTVDETTGAIELNGTACGLADTSNTTQIVVAGDTGDETLVIDNNDEVAFPSTISWQVALGTGTDDGIEIDLTDGADGSVSFTDSGFTMNGGTGLFSGVEWLDAWGGDGNDTIDGSALTATGPEFFAHGQSGDDTITGGAGDDGLEGEPWGLGAGETGDDTISGGAGDDTIYGDEGDDTIDAGAGDDYAEGEEGADTFLEGTAANGSDTLIADSPADTGDVLDYSGRTTATIVNNGSGAADSGEDANGDGDATDTGDERDDVSGFEVIMTGSGADIINGFNGTDETFIPAGGDDEVNGNAGDDDTLDLSGSAAAVTVDVTTGTASGEGDDTFADVESFVGSDHDDTFVSDAGGWTFSGGAGVDTVDYSSTTGGVDVDLDGSLDDDLSAGDIENAIGGSGDDSIDGNGLPNAIWGGAGDDTISGAQGRDSLYGEDDADDLSGDAGDDTLNGGAGADELDGGGGVDLASYADESGAVQVDLSLGTASSPDGDDVGLTDIEGVLGSAFGDEIVGNGATNLLRGGQGDDFVRAGGGDDTVKGAGGDDTLVGGSGDDSIWGRRGNDMLFGGSGTDYGNGGKGADTCKGVEIKKSC